MRQLLLTILFLPCFWQSKAQDVRNIELKQERVPTGAAGYYVADVVDDRTDKNNIGTIAYGGGKIGHLTLGNNAASELATFISGNVTADKSAQRLTIHIHKLNVIARYEGGQWSIKEEVVLAFYSDKDQLAEYVAKGEATRNEEPDEYIESYIRNTVNNDLKAFNSWWAQSKSKVPTDNAVKINVRIAITTNKPDIIVYTTQRPLQIADFTGPSQAVGAEAAATLSGISMSTAGSVEDGRIVINAVITPYFDYRQSWFLKNPEEAHVLAHEQAHFDITAIKACELADSIRATTFTKDNYQQELHRLQQQNTDASNEEETRYDAETQHGIIRDKQEAWEQLLKEKIKTIGCY